MVGIGNFMPSLSGALSGNLHSILDLVFRDNALILADSQVLLPNNAGARVNSLLNSVGLGNVGIPAPLVGFTFETPSEITFMQYSYSEYPYLNKAVIANSYLKETSNTTIRALRPIFGGNGVIANYALNKTLISLIEKYADAGGTFSLNTMWGYFSGFVLERLSGFPVSDMGGIGFEFHLKKINFDSIESSGNLVSKAISKLL